MLVLFSETVSATQLFASAVTFTSGLTDEVIGRWWWWGGKGGGEGDSDYEFPLCWGYILDLPDVCTTIDICISVCSFVYT